MKADKLVRMANQIADNFAYGSDDAKSAASVADHLRRFWTPGMRRLIVEYLNGGGTGLNKVAALAVAALAQEKAYA
jgi:formate dehydrogenase subunit delta